MTRPQWRDVAKEQFWRRMLRRWRESGWTVRAFCDQHDLSEGSFYAWRRILAQRDQEAAQPQRESGAALPAFVQVNVAAEQSVPGDSAAAADGIEVVVGGGRLVRVRRGFDAALLRQVLRVLEEPAC